MEINGKTILLTGASGGIGRAIATRLAAAGAKLIITGRNEQKLLALAAELTPGTIAVTADIATAAGRQRLTDAVTEIGIDVVIHNAGGLDFGLFAEQSPDVLEHLVRLNLLTPALLTQQLLPLLEKRQEAAIVFIGSTFGSIGHPGFVMYCASKFGLRGFAEGLRRELADKPIAVHYLAPRATRTDINTAAVVQMNESIGTAMDEPAVVADELIALLRQRKGCNRYIGWPEKLFVRINSLLPGIVDNALAKKLATVRRFATKPAFTAEAPQ